MNTHFSPDFLNIADFCLSTAALGPGLRSVLWVQGCPIGCPGCISPQWIPIKPAKLIAIESAVEMMLVDSRIEGITISGGEPFLQAAALAKFINLIRMKRDLHVLVFTGFHHQRLVERPPYPGVQELLAQIDIIVDGPYVEALNQGDTFAGSRNQRILRLTNRQDPGDGKWPLRDLEIHIRNGSLLTVGIPPLNLNREQLSSSIKNYRTAPSEAA